MSAISCFPVFKSIWSSQRKSKSSASATSPNPGREVLPVPGEKVWPVSESPTTSIITSPSQGSRQGNRNELSKSSSSIEDRKIISASSEDAPGDDDTDNVDGSPSVRSSLQHVEDWVQNLDELDELEELDDQSGEEEATPDSDQSDPDRDLKDLVLQSLDPLASTARFSGIGLTSPPLLGIFSSLRSLSLSGNSISRIPPGCLPKTLHFLDLSRNKLSTIEGLRGINRLRVLNLSHNRISRIGHGLGNCPSIRELYLSGNKISEVEGLHRLRKLFLLDLSNNRLTTAKSLLQLAVNYSCLEVLNLLGNPLLLNLGDEQMKRLLAAIAPHLKYLNKQPIKAVLARDARLITGADVHGTRKARRSSGSRAKRVENLQSHPKRRLRNKHF